MRYRLPEDGDEAILRAYVQEHTDSGEASVSASMGLRASAYPDWAARMQRNASEGDAQWGRSQLFLCLEGERLVGLLSVRYELPEALAGAIGHIGYGVRPGERRKGYATAMLRHALSLCRESGMTRAILGCYEDNIASIRTIEKCGGVLIGEGDGYQKGRISRYYAIML
ncbi:MAG: GNAT family N-acetyltransferase [Clostridia bacterium]|nr:GNAT family N-acetyltransferase [Clostridia bacterium]